MKAVIKYNLTDLYFLLFVLSVGIHKSAYLILKISGIDLVELFPFTLLIFPIIFLFLAFYQHRRVSFKIADDKANRRFVLIIMIYVHFLLLYGIVNGNNLDVIFQEYYTSILTYLAFKLGDSLIIIRSFQQKLIWIFILFFGLVLMATSYTREHLENLGYSAQDLGTTTASLAYEIAPILDFWPLIFGLFFFNKEVRIKWFYFLIPASFIFIQIYFLKRAPTIRGLSIVLLALSLRTIVTGRIRSIALGLLSTFIILITFYYLLPNALLQRFQQQDTARQDEALNMISQLSSIELIFGKGLGGEFQVEKGGIVQFINEQGAEVNTTLHIGAAYPMLKGGLLLWGIIFVHILYVISKGLARLGSLEDYQLASLTYLIVYCTFRAIEGPITPGSIFDAFLLGYSLRAVTLRHEKKMSNI